MTIQRIFPSFPKNEKTVHKQHDGYDW